MVAAATNDFHDPFKAALSGSKVALWTNTL